MDKAVFSSGDMKVLPMEPEDQMHPLGFQWPGERLYSLISRCIMLESKLLPATDEQTGWVMRFLEERGDCD